MSDSGQKSGIPEGKALDIVDPLGEIRNYAKELWRKDGSPADRDWTTYWQAAEQMVLGGVSSGEPSGRTVADFESPKSPPPEVQKLIDQQSDQPLSILASAFRRLLSGDEARCLNHILATHTVALQNGLLLGPMHHSHIAELLAELTADYDADFLASFGDQAPPRDARVNYWMDKIATANAADVPLTYADRNMIARLRTELVKEERVRGLSFKATPPRLA